MYKVIYRKKLHETSNYLLHWLQGHFPPFIHSCSRTGGSYLVNPKSSPWLEGVAPSRRAHVWKSGLPNSCTRKTQSLASLICQFLQFLNGFKPQFSQLQNSLSLSESVLWDLQLKYSVLFSHVWLSIKFILSSSFCLFWCPKHIYNSQFYQNTNFLVNLPFCWIFYWAFYEPPMEDSQFYDINPGVLYRNCHL